MDLVELRKLCDRLKPKIIYINGVEINIIDWEVVAEWNSALLKYGEELLAVVEAAANIPQMPTPVHRLITPGWSELNEAFLALRSKFNGNT